MAKFLATLAVWSRPKEPIHANFAEQLASRTTVVSYAVLCLLLLILSCSSAAFAQVDVLTRSYNNARTGANLQETILTPANVSAATFGKVFTFKTDGQIYAQPLYVSNLAIAGGTHNVVYVASMLNTVYALDADSGAVLWTQSFGSPIIPQDVESDQNIVWNTRLGILGTPVIDPATNTMYFVSGSQPADGSLQFAFNFNAIDITTGLPVHGSPIKIAASYTTADLTNPLVFNAKIQNPRPGLALGNGNVYVTFASHEDNGPYHGFVMAYSTSTLAQTAVYSDTTTGADGGIWNAGQAPAIDAAGNIYISTGNGSFGKTPNNLVQTGNSFIKLSPGLQLLDYFTPFNSASLNGGDQDLGSSGLLLIPNTPYMLGGGKQGILYLVNSAGMGTFNASADQVKQEFQAVYGKGTSHIHGGPVYFNSAVNGPSLYNWGENDVLRAFTYNSTTALINTAPFAMSTMTAPATNNDGAMPGGFLSISANGNSNGIVWASTPYNGDAVHHSVEGVLYAFDADTLKLLWSDKQNDARDDVGVFAKYVPPVVANGKVYVATFGAEGVYDGTGQLDVYGLLKPDLDITVNNATMIAGAALPALTGTVTGLINGDTLGGTIIVTYSTTAISSSAPGTYPITATVTGASANNYRVELTAGTLTISPSTQTLTVSANNATRAYGAANPAFTGTVTGAQGNDTFTESFSTPATATSAVGTYPIVPSVTGANLANYTVTIVNGALTVTAAPTTTTLTAPATAAYGASVTLSATVTSAAGVPTGSVTFYSGTTSLGLAALNASGVATLTTTTLAGGANTVTAAYAATGNLAASTSSASSVTISPATQTITFPAIASRAYGSAPFAVTATSSAGSSYPVTLSVQSGPAAVSGGTVSLSGAGTVVLLATQAGNADYVAATATQSFVVTPALLTATANNAGRVYDAANPAFTGTVTGTVSGDVLAETFSTTATAASNVGSYPIVPAVSGAKLANYRVTLVNGALTVTGAPTTIALTAPATAAPGANVTLSAAVTSVAGTPVGSVTFSSGSTVLGMAVLTNGTATLSTSALPSGTDTLTAVYATSGNFLGSTSAPATITVNANAQTITFPAVASRAYGSPPFAVTATSSLGSNYPVTISVQSGPASISVGTGGGTVTITGAGTVTLLASQPGDSKYTAATATQSFVVTPAATTTTVSAPGGGVQGSAVTLTVTVASAAGVPGGSVTLYDDATSLGIATLSGGVATLSTSALPAGNDTVTAAFAGAGNFAASSSTALTVAIAAAPTGPPANYTFAATPASLTVTQGMTATTTLTFTPTGGYSGTIALSCANLPTNAVCSFAPSQLKLKGDNQSIAVPLTITTTRQTAARQAPNTGLLALAFWWPGGLAVFARRRKNSSRFWRLGLLMAATGALTAGLSGCGMSGTATRVPTSSVAQVTVTATGTSGSAVITQTAVVTLNMTP